MSTLATLVNKLASRLGIEADGSSLMETLKHTAFKGQVSDAQMTALLIVADQYALNPWTREIHAFPDKNNGIVPVVGVDGWSRIINGHPQFDGIDFESTDESCTCILYRKDRSHPTRVTEYMDECRRGTGPWQSHPRRMLRHKAMIQGARLAFGYGGIYDQDEAERIVEKDMGAAEVVITRPASPVQLPAYSDSDLQKNIQQWKTAIESGRTNSERVITTVSSKYTLSEQQKFAIRALEQLQVAPDLGEDAEGDWLKGYEEAEVSQ